MEYELSNYRVWVLDTGLSILLFPTLVCAGLTAQSYFQLTAQIQYKELVYLGKLDVLTSKFSENYSDFQKDCSEPLGYMDHRAAAQKKFNDAKAAILAACCRGDEDLARICGPQWHRGDDPVRKWHWCVQWNFASLRRHHDPPWSPDKKKIAYLDG